MPLLLAGLQIGSKVASTLLKDDNPKLARNIQALIGGFTAGAEGMSSLAGAFGSPKIGSELSKSTVGKLSTSDGSIMSRLVDMDKGGDLVKPLKSGLGNTMQIGSSSIFNSVGKDIPKDMIGGGFGLEMPKGWNTPKTKGIFDPPGKEEIGWIPGLEF